MIPLQLSTEEYIDEMTLNFRKRSTLADFGFSFNITVINLSAYYEREYQFNFFVTYRATSYNPCIVTRHAEEYHPLPRVSTSCTARPQASHSGDLPASWATRSQKKRKTQSSNLLTFTSNSCWGSKNTSIRWAVYSWKLGQTFKSVQCKFKKNTHTWYILNIEYVSNDAIAKIIRPKVKGMRILVVWSKIDSRFKHLGLVQTFPWYHTM